MMDVPGTQKEWEEFHRECWAKLPEDVRQEAVEITRSELSEKLKANVLAAIRDAESGFPAGAHFGWGMAYRNLLRDHGISDERAGGNLDDFYVPVLHVALYGEVGEAPPWWPEGKDVP